MTTLEIILLMISYLFWGLLQTRQMQKSEYLNSWDETQAFFATIFWPLVYIHRVIWGGNEE